MVLQHSLHLNGERTESKGAFGRDGDAASAISAQPGILALLAALAFDRRPYPPLPHPFPSPLTPTPTPSPSTSPNAFDRRPAPLI